MIRRPPRSTLFLHDALPISLANTTFTASGLTLTGNTTYWVVLRDRKSTRLNSSHTVTSYAVFCLKKKRHYRVRGGCYNSNAISPNAGCGGLLTRRNLRTLVP